MTNKIVFLNKKEQDNCLRHIFKNQGKGTMSFNGNNLRTSIISRDHCKGFTYLKFVSIIDLKHSNITRAFKINRNKTSLTSIHTRLNSFTIRNNWYEKFNFFCWKAFFISYKDLNFSALCFIQQNTG